MQEAPDVLLFCEECKSGVLYQLSAAGQYCKTSGCRNVQGITYVKLETIAELFGVQEATQLMTRIRARQPIESVAQTMDFYHEVPPEARRA